MNSLQTKNQLFLLEKEDMSGQSQFFTTQNFTVDPEKEDKDPGIYPGVGVLR